MFQQQRRGIDELSRTMLILALVLSIIGMIHSAEQYTYDPGWLAILPGCV